MLSLHLEHQSDTKVFTMTMEILLEPTSNKLLVGRSSWIRKEYIKMNVEQQSVKVKELQERCIIKAFKLSYQEKYEHVSPKSQDHKMVRLQDDVKRLCLVDDLKEFLIHIHVKSKPEVYDYYNISQVKDYELKTKVKA
ncbi:hypothetical protein Tco_0972553 [Tanacetum coccineum]